MNNVKTLTATLLLLAAALLSCSDSTDTPTVTDAAQDTTPVVTETADDGRLPAPAVTDMNGATLSIMNSTPESFNWATTTILVDEPDGETLNDALYNREQIL